MVYSHSGKAFTARLGEKIPGVAFVFADCQIAGEELVLGSRVVIPEKEVVSIYQPPPPSPEKDLIAALTKGGRIEIIKRKKRRPHDLGRA